MFDPIYFFQSFKSETLKVFKDDMAIFDDEAIKDMESKFPETRQHSHRILNVPLCASDCDSWYDACKDELTCTSNWYTGFTWEQGFDGRWHNLCKETKEDACKPISHWYSNSKDFCQVNRCLDNY